MKKMTIVALILLALLISGCNFPGNESETPDETDDTMATEISKILTGTPVQIEPTATSQEVGEETTAPADTEEPAATPTSTLEPEEEEATPAPTNTPTVEPTATLADTDPAAALGAPDWVDTMEDGDNWPTGINKYTSIAFKDGYLKLMGETELDGWRLSWPFLTDFYLEAKVQSPNCEGSDHFGVMFRVPEKADANKGYLFGITCDGRYSLRRWDGQTMYFPIKWTASDSIKTGEGVINKLGVMAKGANLALFINGEKINEVSDNAYLQGNFGIFVGSNTTEDITVWVDEIRYWENP